MDEKIKVLILEDMPEDAELVEQELKKTLKNYTLQVTDNEKGFIDALKNYKPDLILSDYNLPQFNGMEAIKLTKEISPLTPVIIVTGSINEEIAVDCIKAGAKDYVLKENLTRLGPAITQVLEKKALIEARIKADEAVKESEEQYFMLFNNANELIQILDSTGKFLAVNKEWMATLEYSKEEVKNLQLLDIIRKDKLQQVGELMQGIKGGESISFETIFISKSGKEIIVEGNGNGIFKDGKLISMIGMFRDITERKKTENDLCLSEKKFRSYVEQASEGIYLFELKKPISINMPVEEQIKNIYEGYIIEANDSQAKMYGFDKANELNGMTLAEFHGGTDNPENLEFLRSWIEANYRITDAESKEVDKDGNELWFTNNIIGYVEDGYLIHIWGTQTDITERKQAEKALKNSEERLKILFESAPDAIYLNDLKGTFIDGNRAAEDLMGYTREELIGESFLKLKLISGKELLKASKLLVKNIQGKGTGPDELILNRKDGSQVTVEILTYPVKIKDKTMVLGIAHDITERKQAEEQIKKDLAEKNVLLQEIYHRTKNNMQVIASMLKMKSRQSDDEFVHDSFNDIVRKIQAMSLVHEKLYQAKDLSRINLKEYIEDILLMMIRYSTVNSELFSYKLELEEVFITIDSATPLGLVLNELISNVFMHSFPNDRKGELTISLEQEKSGDIKIQLSDDGVGPSADFDPEKSNLIGLQTVYSLVVYQLGGSINYEAKDGLSWFIKFNDSKNKLRV